MRWTRDSALVRGASWLVVLGSLGADLLVHGLEPRSRGPVET